MNCVDCMLCVQDRTRGNQQWNFDKLSVKFTYLSSLFLENEDKLGDNKGCDSVQVISGVLLFLLTTTHSVYVGHEHISL